MSGKPQLRSFLQTSFMLGFTKVVNEVSSFLTEEHRLTLQGHGNYNPIAKGIQQDRNLDKVIVEFNIEVELSASFDDLFASSQEKQEGPAEEPTQPTKPRVEGSSKAEAGVDVIASAEAKAETDNVMIDIEQVVLAQV